MGGYFVSSMHPYTHTRSHEDHDNAHSCYAYKMRCMWRSLRTEQAGEVGRDDGETRQARRESRTAGVHDRDLLHVMQVNADTSRPPSSPSSSLSVRYPVCRTSTLAVNLGNVWSTRYTQAF